MYSMKPSLMFWPVQMPQCKKSRLTIKAVGLASKGSLQVCYLKGIKNSFNHIYNGANMIYLALGWVGCANFLVIYILKSDTVSLLVIFFFFS